jgi:hypothetical protein
MSVRAELRSKSPHTWSVVITAREGQEPLTLYDALVDAGFRHDPQGDLPPDASRRVERIFVRRGSGIFGMWTDTEEREYMASALAVLARFGHPRVQRRRLRMEDCL